MVNTAFVIRDRPASRDPAWHRHPEKEADIILLRVSTESEAEELVRLASTPSEQAGRAARATEGALKVTSDQGLCLVAKRLSGMLLLSREEVPPQLRALIDTALSQMVDCLDVKARFQMAERVSQCSDVPRELFRRLMNDCEAVAAPLLESSHVLADLDLLQLALTAGEGHRRLIARRADVSAAIANILVKRDEDAVVRTLLGNKSIWLSGSTVDLILAKFGDQKDIMTALAEREDLQPAHAFDIFWRVDAPRRHKILSRFALSRRQIREAAGDIIQLINEDLGLRSPAARGLLRFVFGPVSELAGEDAWADGHDSMRFDQLLMTLKKRSYIRRKTFAKILADPGGEPLAVLCKAVSVKKGDLICLARLLYRVHGGGGPGQKADEPDSDVLRAYLNRVSETYDRLSWDGADLVLRYWDTPVAR